MPAVEPERELIRRVLPFAGPAIGLALGVGWLVGGSRAGWSAAIGVTVVLANFVASGLSVAWAARISPTLMMGVALGGFVVRLGLIALILAALDGLPWFSTATFVAAVVPATIVLLVFEGKLLSGRMQVDLWSPASEGPR